MAAASPPKRFFSSRQSAHPLLQLQRIIGNQAVQRLMQSGTPQGGTETSEDDSIAQRIKAAVGSGGQLDANIQQRLKKGLGADLSNVRVHTDCEADWLARSVNAVAFTSGQDIFFRDGAYDPTSEAGMRLLAHEMRTSPSRPLARSRARPRPGASPSAIPRMDSSKRRCGPPTRWSPRSDANGRRSRHCRPVGRPASRLGC